MGRSDNVKQKAKPQSKSFTDGPVYFEIEADDTERTIDFYGQVFEWKFSEAKGLPVPNWRLEAGVAKGGLFKRPAKKPPSHCGANAFVCSLEIENFDATEKKILKLGGMVALPKFPVPGTCWQGYFVDTEGNTFGIFEVDENAGKKKRLADTLSRALL